MKSNFMLRAVRAKTTVACCAIFTGLYLVITCILNDGKVTHRNPEPSPKSQWVVLHHATDEVTLISPRHDSIRIGDLLHYHIRSNLTDSGGEFYEARLTSPFNPRASTAGHFVDHANGTYSVYFFAGWGGRATLSIVRVLKREAVTFLNDVVWNAEDRVVWQGYFDVDGARGYPELMPTGLCKLRNRGNWSGWCVYPHRKALGNTVFLCKKKPGVDCNSLFATKSDQYRIEQKSTELASGKEKLFDKNQDYRQRIHVTDSTITISETPRPAASKAKLPRCSPDEKLPLSHGYWFEGSWISLICQMTDWTSPEKLSSCLRNKNLILLGDSTTRQWFEMIHRLLLIPCEQRSGDLYFSWRRHHSFLNATIFFTSTPQLIGRRIVTMEEVNYEVDVLDGLNVSNCNYIVLVSPWAHFSQWVRSHYVERTQHLREALIRLRKKCPDVKIVLKGAHSREHKTFSSVVYSSDFLLKSIDQINRRAFSGIGVWYLPVWAMNMAYPEENTIHMPLPVILEELRMFFSYVCEK